MSYAAKIENGVVTEVILGSAEWASTNLDGLWVGSENKIWIGGSWDETHGFRPPQPFPSWIWDNGRWVAPITEPEWDAFWDEDSLSWVAADGGD